MYLHGDLSPDENIALLKKAVLIFEFLFEDGDYMHFSMCLASAYRRLAAWYIEKSETETALEMLKKAVPYVVMYDSLPEHAVHTSVLVRGLEFNRLHHGKFEKSYCESFIRELKSDDEFDSIRESQKFTSILASLNKHK